LNHLEKVDIISTYCKYLLCFSIVFELSHFNAVNEKTFPDPFSHVRGEVSEEEYSEEVVIVLTSSFDEIIVDILVEVPFIRVEV